MNVKKFRAANTREALRQVRDSLGADAIILSNRPVDGMIEIMAVANMDMASLATPVLAAAPVIRQPRNPYAQEPRTAPYGQEPRPPQYDAEPRPDPASQQPRPVKREEISVLQRTPGSDARFRGACGATIKASVTATGTVCAQSHG